MVPVLNSSFCRSFSDLDLFIFEVISDQLVLVYTPTMQNTELSYPAEYFFRYPTGATCACVNKLLSLESVGGKKW